MDDFNKMMMYIQLAVGVAILVINVSTYKFAKWPIRYLLFFQSIQMSLSNFNQYRRGTETQQNADDNKFFDNWMALNVMVGIFATMFTTFNTLLLAFVSTEEEKVQKILMITINFGCNILLVIYTNFKFDDISELAIITIIVSIAYTVVVVPFFLAIVDAILFEAIQEAKESQLAKK
jgi:hypothetical protein